MNEVRTTYHAKDRTKDRMGLSKKLCDKKAQEALTYGISHSEATGKLNKYINALYLRHLTGNNIRIYHRYVYIFEGNLLVTILHLPKDLIALADKIQKRKTESRDSI